MRTLPSKLNGERRVIPPDVKLFVLDAYIRGTTWSLTIEGSTGEVRWRMCQLVWLAGTQIGLGNLPGIN